MTEIHIPDDLRDLLTPLDEIHPYGDNPKKHPDRQLDKIEGEIRKHGWDVPIVVDGSLDVGEIVKGHGRYFVARDRLDRIDVPVVWQDYETEADKRAERLGDNRSAESDWDDDLLAVELEWLDQNDFDFDDLAFDDDEIDNLLEEIESESINELDEPSISDKELEDVEILNLYAGVGGNRKLWGDEPNVTAVEYNDEIAEVYQDFYPDDTVIVTDAHEYLLEHFDEFDFIWTSPPCPTHSKLRKNLSVETGADPVYPDLKLYEEILFLQGYFDGKWVVENVDPWYDPLIEPQKSGRHIFWANFDIPELESVEEIKNVMDNYDADEQARQFGYDPDKFDSYSFPSDYPRDKIINNMVNPKVGKSILESAIDQSDQPKVVADD